MVPWSWRWWNVLGKVNDCEWSANSTPELSESTLKFYDGHGSMAAAESGGRSWWYLAVPSQPQLHQSSVTRSPELKMRNIRIACLFRRRSEVLETWMLQTSDGPWQLFARCSRTASVVKNVWYDLMDNMQNKHFRVSLLMWHKINYWTIEREEEGREGKEEGREDERREKTSGEKVNGGA